MIEIYIQKAEKNPSEAAHGLLHRILQEQYGIPAPVEHRAPGGKPYLAQGPFIGISHSRGWLAAGVGDVPFGVDLETVTRRVQPGLAQRVFSGPELLWYRQQGSTADAFMTLWTLKESYYKYLGTGLPGFPDQTEFCYEGRWKLRASPCSFAVCATETLRIAVCSYTEQSVRYYVL